MDRKKDTLLNRTDTDYAWSALQLLGHDHSSVTSTNSLGSFCEYSYLNAPSCSFISILRALWTSTNFCILFIRNFFFSLNEDLVLRDHSSLFSGIITTLYLSSFHTFINIKYWPQVVPYFISPYDGWHQEQDAKLKLTRGTWMRH